MIILTRHTILCCSLPWASGNQGRWVKYYLRLEEEKMWEHESTDKSILQGISGVGVVLVKGTQSVCGGAQNSCGDSICQVPLTPLPLEGPPWSNSEQRLSDTVKIQRHVISGCQFTKIFIFIFKDEKNKKVSPACEQQPILPRTSISKMFTKFMILPLILLTCNILI